VSEPQFRQDRPAAPAEGRARVRVYAVLPTFGPGSAAAEILDFARAAEELGFDGVATTDHVLVPAGPPGEPDRYERVFDLLTVLAAVASVTTRVSLVTSVVVLPMREPVLVAKQIATIDEFSAGRVIFGVGAGYNEQEFRNVGASFRDRGQRFDEALRLLGHLFSGSVGPFEGRYYGYQSGAFDPLPHRGRHLPIMLGGLSDAALRRAARFGDMWQSNPFVAPAGYPELRDRLAAYAGGRAISAGARIQVSGGGREMLATSMAFANAGAEHLTIEFFPAEDPGRQLETFGRDVLPNLPEMS
jgi:probable F420-dependent oxidoreductase